MVCLGLSSLPFCYRRGHQYVSNTTYILNHYTFEDKKLTACGARPFAVSLAWAKVHSTYYLSSMDLRDAASECQVLIFTSTLWLDICLHSVQYLTHFVSPKKVVISLFEKEMGTVTMDTYYNIKSLIQGTAAH